MLSSSMIFAVSFVFLSNIHDVHVEYEVDILWATFSSKVVFKVLIDDFFEKLRQASCVAYCRIKLKAKDRILYK